MSAYLQRLYDAAGAAAAVDARPAQRSSSPLLAVDQRLASATYAASFLLALPGEADAGQGPAPEPEALDFSAPLGRDSVASRGQPPLRAPVPRPAPAETPVPDVEERVRFRPRTDHGTGSPERLAPSQEADTVLPDAAARGERPPVAGAAWRREAAPSPRPAAQPLSPRVDPAVPLAPRPEPGPAEPAVATRLEVPPAPVAEVAAPPAPFAWPVWSAPAGPRAESADPVPLLHPVPAAAPEPAPAPAAPRPAERVEFAEQVRRLVREAMAGETVRPGPAGGRESRTADSAPPSRPATAEAVSVIGPLDRPARATTLYGLRVR
jgi:hypothetical protein